MSIYTTTHLYNVTAGREADYQAWFDGEHGRDLSRLRGFRSADRYEVTPEQVMPDIAQPWRFMSVYEFDYPAPEIDLPALGPLLAEVRDSGLIDDANESERIFSYAMYRDWYSGPNHNVDKPFSGMFIIPANFVAGMEAEYHDWYDNVHIPEVCRVPGFVAMKRGRLSPIQIEPKRFCPGSEIVMCAHQTDDLLFSVKDFSARARGVSPSGEAMEPRSKAGSFARTVHFFKRISGAQQWDGGIAYAGDLSVYPADFRITGA
ncbi:MAG: hypothetical protein ACT6R2_16240 [Blastomonas fulva]|uniref:hypothetical protein n=1 Tax=Blastomonas fulva TaxID=1550728 RepID=UPI00403315E4